MLAAAAPLMFSLALAPGSADAPRVGFAIETSDNVPANARTAFSDRLTTAMSYAGHAPIAVDVGGCGDDTCMGTAARTAGAAALVIANVELDARDYVIEARVIDLDGQVLQSVESSCDICTYDEAADALAESLAGLGDAVDQALAAAQQPEATTGTLAVRGEPQGAAVLVDGQRVGAIPYQGPVDSGEHTVTIERDGYEAQTQTIVIEADAQQSLEVSLNRGRRKGGKLSRREAIGWAALGASIPFLVAGPVLIGINDKPYEGTCTGNDVDAFGNCRFQYDTIGGGVALTVVGVGAAVTGITLIALERRKSGKDDRKATVRVSPTLSGAMVHGRF